MDAVHKSLYIHAGSLHIDVNADDITAAPPMSATLAVYTCVWPECCAGA